MQNPSQFPGGFNSGVVIRNMPVLNAYPGKVFWVDENGSGGADGSFNRPYPTISAAHTACVASRGDTILVKPNHTETFTAALALSKAGVSIVGMGQGSLRPTITGAETLAIFTVSAAGVTIENLIMVSPDGGTQASTRMITVSATHCGIYKNEFQCNDSSDDAVYIDYAGDYADVRGNVFRVLANGPDTAVMLEGATGGNSLTGVNVSDNFFDGMSTTNSWDLGVIYSSGVHIQGRFERNRVLFMAANVGGIEFVAAATGIIADNYFGNGTLAQMLDPGSCMCFLNKEADAVDENARTYPWSDAA